MNSSEIIERMTARATYSALWLALATIDTTGWAKAWGFLAALWQFLLA